MSGSADCKCEFCTMLRKGWVLISPGGHVFSLPKPSPSVAVRGDG